MSADLPFDRSLRRSRRQRALREAHNADYLHILAAEELLERLGLVKRGFTDVLILGGPGRTLSTRLSSLGMKVVAADPASGGGAEVLCDEDRLPFADASFDLIVSVGLLDSVNDLPGALTLIRRCLRPDGLFLGALSGAGSLPRLREAMAAADAVSGGASPHIHPQIDVRAAGDLLARARFALPVADSDIVTVRFSSLSGLISDLRAMGATNCLAARARRHVARKGLAAATMTFSAAADPDGKTQEDFAILYISGWAPSPDQPQPARRGSATHSLAEAIGKKPS